MAKFLQQFRKGPVFGVALDPDNGVIPQIVIDCIEYLKCQDLETEGLFRISGNMADIKRLKEKYDKGGNVDLKKEDNIHNVTGLLKMYFRELPDPLLTFECYDMFIAANGVNQPAARLDVIKKCLSFLPPTNNTLIEYLLDFLHSLLKHEAKTKMSASNLAIVFAPNVLRHVDDSVEIAITDANDSSTLFTTLISDFPYFFPPEAKKQKELPKSQPRPSHPHHPTTTSSSTSSSVARASPKPRTARRPMPSAPSHENTHHPPALTTPAAESEAKPVPPPKPKKPVPQTLAGKKPLPRPAGPTVPKKPLPSPGPQ
eukprot:GCRY01004911.1.p1 GENE.GCRY01004911.1~~GCRY01004911.1.p1  ORF type:complete len:314 (+),score=49.33 GCRY01004911.1:250-1191(+)